MHFTRFRALQQFSEIKEYCAELLYPGQSDPRQLTDGAQGPYDRPAWPARPEQPGHGGLLQVSMEAVLRCRKKKGDGVLSDPWLTRGTPAWSAWPEMVGQRRILRRRWSGPARASAMAAAIQGVPARFVGRGGRGRGGGPSQLVGGAGGSAERRPRWWPWRRYSASGRRAREGAGE
jgi:hypothetical protein